MKKLSFIILLFPYYVLLTLSPPDSCLKIYDIPEDETFENPYNVRVDSCDGSATYGNYFAKGYFSVKFKYNIIPRTDLFPKDTLIEYNISDIDTIYPNAITEFQNLESQYGTFKFIEERPHRPDTTTLNSRKLSINFDNYVNIHSAEEYIDNINIVTSVGFAHWFRVLSTVKETQDFSFLNYNTQTEILNIQNKLGIESKLVIYNIHGNEVLTQNIASTEASISLTRLTSGVYFIYFNDKIIKLMK